MTEAKVERIHICGESLTTAGEAGRTGEWRTSRPVVDNQRCTPARKGQPSCFICWLYCPEAVIKRTVPVQIDLEYCKGCGICAEECPTQAISMVEESSFRSGTAERPPNQRGVQRGRAPLTGRGGVPPQVHDWAGGKNTLPIT